MLYNLVFVVIYDGKVSGVQMKFSGIYLKEKYLVYWCLGDVMFIFDFQKIVCWIVGVEGVELFFGYVEVCWEYVVFVNDVFGSGIMFLRFVNSKGKGKEILLDDLFVDEDYGLVLEYLWVNVFLVWKLVSGKYEVK